MSFVSTSPPDLSSSSLSSVTLSPEVVQYRDRVSEVLWIILFVVFVAGIVIFLVFQPPAPVSTPSVPSVSCSGELTNVPDVNEATRFTTCCDINGNINQRFYDKTNNWTVINLNAQDAPSSAQVCIDFCDQVQLPTDCINQGTTYQNCLTLLTPQNCTDPSLPAARSGDTPYYAIGKGFVSCYPCS